MTEVENRILEISDRLNRLERTNREVPLYQLPPFEHDVRVPPAESVELVSAQPTSGATKVAIRWTKPADPNIDHFEIWVKRTAFESENPYQAASVADSPCAFTVNSDRDTTAVAYIRTVMKNGLSTDLNASPTVSFNVYKFVASSTDIAPGAIQNGHFDRVSANRIQIWDADIDRVSANRVQIRDADIDRVSANRLQVRYGDIASLRVGNIYGGMPGQMTVYNAIGLPIGFIGTSDDGVSGGWFKQLYIGGDSPQTARLVSDSFGNLSIMNASVTIVDTEGQTIRLDGTYGLRAEYATEANRFYARFNRAYMLIEKWNDTGSTMIAGSQVDAGGIAAAGYASGLRSTRVLFLADSSTVTATWESSFNPGIQSSAQRHAIIAGSSASTCYADFYSLRVNGITVIDSNRQLQNVTLPAHSHSGYAPLDHSHSEYAAASHSNHPFLSVDGVTVIDSDLNIGDMDNCHTRVRNSSVGMTPGEIVAYYDSNIEKCVLKFYDGENTFTFVSK